MEIKMANKSPLRVAINEEKCVGCQICMLWCSYIHEKTFIPSKAHLQIKRMVYNVNFFRPLRKSPDESILGNRIRYCFL